MKNRAKSTILFIICVLVIGFLAYSGVYGVNAGGYRLKSFGEVITRGLDLQGGVSVLEEIQADKVDQETINKTTELISLRVNKMGVSETVVTREGQKRIRIEIPGKFDAKEIEESIGKTGELKFVGPDNSTILTGKDVKKASAYINPDDAKPAISLEFNDAGTKKFSDATQKFLGQQISIKMDEEVLETANVAVQISNGKAQISGGTMTLEQATRKANVINSGALPVTVKVVETKTIGASLGANALPLSILAGKVGIAIVMLFMVLYYRIPGILASIALVLYVYVVLLAFASLNVTLTLAGIAGFLLTVGMSVDASILIFERMKEELKGGKSVKAAIDAGFHRAMTSVIDSHITTIVAGIVLYGLGSGAVKGFALTLVVGVGLSLFTAVIVTRYLIKIAAGMGWFKHKWSIGTFGVHDFRRGAK